MKLASARESLAAVLLAAGIALAPLVSHAEPGPQQAAQKTAPHRLVLKVSENDPASWNLALNNAENVQQVLGKDKVRIEIVAYGPGLNMLKSESKVANRLTAALDANVGLIACGTTMRKMKLTEADLAGGIKVVPAGVVHIMERQSEGWNYVKP